MRDAKNGCYQPDAHLDYAATVLLRFSNTPVMAKQRITDMTEPSAQKAPPDSQVRPPRLTGHCDWNQGLLYRDPGEVQRGAKLYPLAQSVGCCKQQTEFRPIGPPSSYRLAPSLRRAMFNRSGSLSDSPTSRRSMAAVPLSSPRAEAIRKISLGDRIDTGISGSPMRACSRIIPRPALVS